MASIDKPPNGKWRARWREYPGSPQKARHFERKIDAQRFLTDIEHSKLTGSYVDPAAGQITFQAYAEQWRAVQVHRPGTATSVEQHLRLHVYPLIGHRLIAAIRPTEMKALVKHLRTALASSTVTVVYGRVVAVLRAAVADRLIARSPCEGIRSGRVEPRAPDEVLTRDHVLELAAAIRRAVDGALGSGTEDWLRTEEAAYG